MKKNVLLFCLLGSIILVHAEEFKTGYITNYYPADAVYLGNTTSRPFVAEITPTENGNYLLKIIFPVLGTGTFTYVVKTGDTFEMAKYPNITQKVRIRIIGADKNKITFEEI